MKQATPSLFTPFPKNAFLLQLVKYCGAHGIGKKLFYRSQIEPLIVLPVRLKPLGSIKKVLVTVQRLILSAN